MSEEQVFDLSVKATLENLQEVRSFIDRVGASLAIDEIALGDLRLVVDEAVTNVCVYGHAETDGTVELRMHAEGDAVFIRIRDRAATFDPGHIKAPQLDTELKERPFGGMGIFLIKKMTDEAEFLPLPGGGNEIRLVKRGVIQTDSSDTLV